MPTKVRIGNIGGAISEPAIDKNSWQFLNLKYGTNGAAKKLGVSKNFFREVITGKRKNLTASQVDKIEKRYAKLPKDVKRRAAVASDLFKEATPRQKLEFMPQMVKTRKGQANLNRMLDKHAKNPRYSPFGKNRFGSPKMKKAKR